MLNLDVQLTALGLSQYHEALVHHGFRTWQSLLSVTEADMTRCRMKLGHQRKLQRAIAKFQGTPDWKPIGCSNNLEARSCPTISHLAQRIRLRDTMKSKRRYRRLPPKDRNAPPRPQSGYVLFASFLRQNVQVSDLPFVSIAKLVGHQWDCLSTDERKTWLSQAADERSKYKVRLSKYQQTEDYNIHQDYLQVYECSKSGHDTCSIHPRTKEIDQNQKHATSSRNESPDSISVLSSSQELANEPIMDPSRHVTTNVHYSSIYSVFRRVSQSSAQETDEVTTSQRYQLAICPDHGRFDLNLLELRTAYCTPEYRDYYMQDLNPFHALSRAFIWPFLDAFLQHVNRVCDIFDREYLVHHFLLATDTKNTLSSGVLHTLCFCISIGCQVHDSGTDEMAIYWHENGRGYLETDGWDLNLEVMKTLVLIGMFHASERPATAHRYIGTACQMGIFIGEEAREKMDGLCN